MLQKIIDEYNPIIVALQETRLQNDIRYQGYQAIRKDRVTRGLRGGGVALLVSDNVPYTCHKIDTDIEAVAIKLYFGNYQHTVCSVCLPPADC